MSEKISARLFDLDSNIRYVAINQKGLIVEMEQNPKRPSLNPTETDRMEELIVNPVILELARRRGNLDMDGIRYVVVRYGTMYELIFPFKDGHLSIGIELKANPTEVAQKVASCLGLAS
jgi:predicted AAA+ superfamily ATPase